MVNDEKTLVSRDGKKRTLGKIDHTERNGKTLEQTFLLKKISQMTMIYIPKTL
jgi:hypothetical protein